MFTTTEKETFANRGLLKKENFLPPKKLQIARGVLQARLAEEGFLLDNQWALPIQIDSTAPDAGRAYVKALKRHPDLTELLKGKVANAASALVDNRALEPMLAHPALLFTMPNATNWTVPFKSWHLDMPRLEDGSIPGVQIFTFLEPVQAKGGGTLVVTGSHRLLNHGERISSSKLRKRLQREPFFGKLFSGRVAEEQREQLLGAQGYVNDVELRVVELTGEPGDIYFMDLRILHTIAPNILKIPRIMLTQRYLLESTRLALEK